MQTNREIRLSVKDRISSIFTSPPAGSGFSAFNVYDEDDYRNDAHTPAPNVAYIYLIDSFLLPVETKLPVVVLEIERVRHRTFELGNRVGRHVRAHAHCFGRNRGERDDLSGFIADYFGDSFPIKTYPTGTTTETVQVLENSMAVENMSIGNEDANFGGEVMNWSRASWEFYTKL